MKIRELLFIAVLFTFSCSHQTEQSRIVEDLNFDWKFNLGEASDAFNPQFDDSNWKKLNVPHDWSIEEGYQQKEGTAASTGFVPGGIGWYRKKIKLSKEDQGKHIRIVFDGVYNNSTVWINGHKLGTRPYGYSTFSYDLTPFVNFGNKENILAVKVDRTQFVDSRWYTGSGIYRKVQLLKTSPLHVAFWGVQITTPEVTDQKATVNVTVNLENSRNDKFNNVVIKYIVFNPSGGKVAEQQVKSYNIKGNAVDLIVDNPKRWSLESPNLYLLKVEVIKDGVSVDKVEEHFGIRTFEFDANTGFSLNGTRMKIKGVNLHHDGGAVGAAVPKGIWEYRIGKLKEVGANAVRMSHNPHSKELMEVCDEMGMLVMNEAFDEWDRPKGKNLVYIGDNKAPKEGSRSYPELFNEWCEKDLKDLILRDFNHPSVIMWSIGNEIEWTFPYYSKTYNTVNGSGKKYYNHCPIYDSVIVRTAFDEITGEVDTMVMIANKLSKWVREMDPTRPVTVGSVMPSIGLASGYGSAVDVYGFNYRAKEYDGAHKEYPNAKIIGSENWGSYSEWKNCMERDFVSGIFVWTGFAYLGEAGPWPRKGLNISFFDFAGFKNARGHFYECLWNNNPKVYMVTTPAVESEYSFTKDDGWKFEMQYYKPPIWAQLRLWEWYKTYPKWKYNVGENIVVQIYTNCEEAELFLNGTSLGKQKRSEFADDNIIKWMVPYQAGELKVLAYNDGDVADEYSLSTPGDLSKIKLESTKTGLKADGYDVAILTVELLDENSNLITDSDQKIEFEIAGPVKNIGVDNGWELNVQTHKANSIITHRGKAILIVQSTKEFGNAKITALCKGLKSETIDIFIN